MRNTLPENLKSTEVLKILQSIQQADSQGLTPILKNRFWEQTVEGHYPDEVNCGWKCTTQTPDSNDPHTLDALNDGVFEEKEAHRKVRESAKTKAEIEIATKRLSQMSDLLAELEANLAASVDDLTNRSEKLLALLADSKTNCFEEAIVLSSRCQNAFSTNIVIWENM
eukprot:Gregarina_sp_Pseudo_9__3346@NODE_3522_length_624_cov_6_341880_g3217_i0_p1_GENE_NODE_3522_length_624_cov_6_341880_g3217_i0NODE_3522_length_624_cov_6_341880_g3217_i0_p1_ORF_typecomplete_len168_score12_98DUF349/PF03993_12/0_012Atg14/PF10186_9/0_045DUF4200/PF13863_6/0_061SAS4/PF15460_6/6_8e02SAS4/PF15460_6/0_83HAUS5/PF14817_6/0_27_NODE_3522_length_624_cov_6_341880_g3217_i0106609